MDQLDQPVETETPDAAAGVAPAGADQAGEAVAAAGDDLVEDVSIDGMCGVY